MDGTAIILRVGDEKNWQPFSNAAEQSRNWQSSATMPRAIASKFKFAQGLGATASVFHCLSKSSTQKIISKEVNDSLIRPLMFFKHYRHQACTQVIVYLLIQGLLICSHYQYKKFMRPFYDNNIVLLILNLKLPSCSTNYLHIFLLHLVQTKPPEYLSQRIEMIRPICKPKSILSSFFEWG